MRYVARYACAPRSLYLDVYCGVLYVPFAVTLATFAVTLAATLAITLAITLAVTLAITLAIALAVHSFCTCYCPLLHDVMIKFYSVCDKFVC